MLNPKRNRLDYGSILSPPSNYELDFAVGATYSLDLDALVGASISLGLAAENDSDLNENPIFLLEALRSAGDKIALFCESGQIKLPKNPTPLYILLEEMVFQVTNANEVAHSRYASFHPKVWLIRYIGNEGVLYRFAILSRNLTFDRSWDLSFSMDGRVGDETTSKNSPLIRFLEYLSSYSTNDDKTSRINEIIDELEHVHFELNSRVFEDFEFIVNGIDGANPIQNQQLFRSNSLENLLIMSPFLSKDVISDFNDRMNSKAVLITRFDSLGLLKGENLDNFEFYVLRDEVVDGESLLSEDSFKKQDIHAKMYVVEKRKYTDLYIGSLNASHNALHGNVEFMIRLSARKRRLNIDKLMNDIFNDGKDNPFKKVDITDIEFKPDEGTNLNLVVKDIVRLDARARVISHDGKYDLEVDFSKIYDSHEIDVRPLLSKKTRKFAQRVLFTDLDKDQLSEFFVITVRKDEDSIERVIKIPVDNMPDDRQKDVVSKIIDDRSSFIRYVAFLLGDEYVLGSVEEDGTGDGSISPGFTVQLPELYEKMLKSAMYAPEKFEELEFLIRTLSEDDVIPEGFEELYNTFREVIDDG